MCHSRQKRERFATAIGYIVFFSKLPASLWNDWLKTRNFATQIQKVMSKYILADNQELTRLALETLIKQVDNENEVFKTTDKSGIIGLLREHTDATVVLDYTLLDFSGEEQLLIIAERFADARWIIISEELTPSFMRRVIFSSHRFNILFKDCTQWEVTEALKTAAEGGRYVAQRVMETIITEQQNKTQVPDLLTVTETEIVKSIAQGKTTKEIAAERFLSIHTITTHRKNIFRKLGVNTAHEVVKYALRAGLVDSNEFYI